MDLKKKGAPMGFVVIALFVLAIGLINRYEFGRFD